MDSNYGHGVAHKPLYLRQKRINKLPEGLVSLGTDTSVRVGVPVEHVHDKLVRVGFPAVVTVGHTVLPSSKLGATARRNAEGWNIIHREQPKETAYREHYWCREQWCGRDETETVCTIVDIPYLRYPRTFVPPPSVEMTVSANSTGKLILVAKSVQIGAGDALKHIINLFLEAFGECQVFYQDLTALVFPKMVRLNWTVLPQGRRPWETLRQQVESIINKAKPANRVLVSQRLEFINSFAPSFVAVGQAGFAGYLVFGFPERGIFVLESIYTNNAIYTFDERWEALSQMSKAEILDGGLQQRRFVHRRGWEGELRAYLLPKPPPDDDNLRLAA